MSESRTIVVDYLARVEGEGGLHIRIRDDRVEDVKLKIFEPPRFFEGLLRGRRCEEAPDITARICGICPIAYQTSACSAMEQILGVELDPPLRLLRRLIYCGEWIESHALHVFMLHAPDFLGYDDAMQMAVDHAERVNTGLALKKVGNDLMTLIGGREVHPINPRVGGFYKTPRRRDFADITERLKRAREAAIESVRWTATFDFPEFEEDYEFVAMRHPDEYPMAAGRLVSNRGLDIDVSEFDDHFSEEHVEHSNALHCVLRERDDYLVGPLARYRLNHDRLPEVCTSLAREIGLGAECRNPFRSILVRGIEIVFAIDEALRLIESYEDAERPYVSYEYRAGTGYGCSEAPRGICYHRYSIDAEGLITDAQIVPPTSQNQKRIEHDLRAFVPQYATLSKDELTWRCEQAIRNYDPCISCATHFLELDLDRA